MSVLAVFSRHPRYAILLFAILLTLLYILSSPNDRGEVAEVAVKSDVNSSDFIRQDYAKPMSLKDVLRKEEGYYQEMVEERKKAIVKWEANTKASMQGFPEPVGSPPFYTLWDFFLPAFQCPHRVERIGIMGDGGKYACGFDRVVKQKECVIYTFGVNGESSFEASLLTRAPHCQVWGYDFSVDRFGPEIDTVPSLKSRSHFFAYGLGPLDETKTISLPWDDHAQIEFYSLQSLMAKNGHTFIDVLKIDIEGGEFESLESFIDNIPRHPHGSGEVVLPVGQIQLEIHARADGYEQFPKFKKWFEKLEAAGLRPFYNEPNLVYINLVRGSKPDLVEYSFMNIRGEHALTSDHYTG